METNKCINNICLRSRIVLANLKIQEDDILKIINKINNKRCPGYDMFLNFKFESVTNEQIIKIIEGLKSKRSSGYDGMFSILLKQIKCEISPCLTILLNQCMTSGIFHEKLKKLPKLYQSLKKEMQKY